MSDELIKILSNSNKAVDDQKLIEYLSGKLSANEKQKFEELIEEPGFLKDAVQGLQQFENKEHLPLFVTHLNTNLQRHLHPKKHRLRKRRFKSEQWIYIAVIAILSLIILGFIVIRAFYSN